MRIFVIASVGVLALGSGVIMRVAVGGPSSDFVANVSGVPLTDEPIASPVSEPYTLASPAGGLTPSTEGGSASGGRPYTLVFVGDIMLSRSVGKVMRDSNDFHYPFLKIADRIRAADIAFANLEGPISKRGVNQGSKFSFRADPRVAPGLSFAGFDVLSLANNHIFDWGRDALFDTLNVLELQRIVPVGAGRNYGEANTPKIIDLEDARVAFLAYTTLAPANWKATAIASGISDATLSKIKDQVAAADRDADIVVVSLHWGEEYRKSPSDAQRTLAHALVDAGADLVIGHHPHVVQEVEHYVSNARSSEALAKDGWIAYSLGNFVFDQGFREDTMRGLMLEVIVEGGKISGVYPVPIKINTSFQPERIAS